jgi:hypothetical protein
MAWIVADSWDYYSLSADVARSVWDSVPSPPTFTNQVNQFGRFYPSQAVWPGTNTFTCIKNFTNAATVFVVCALYWDGSFTGGDTTVQQYFKLQDGGAAQATICLLNNGDIVLKRGDWNGTVVATIPASNWAPVVWTHFQFRVVIDPTAGTFTMRKNGVTTDTFSATGLNTRATANSFANSFGFGRPNVAGPTTRIDDLLVYSGTAPAPNDWVGDVRAICLMAAADTAQKQFSPIVGTMQIGDAPFVTLVIAPNVLHTGGVQTSPYNAPPNGAIYMPRSGTVTKVTLNSSGAQTGHAKVAIYMDDGLGNSPGTLVAVSNEVTNPPNGATDFTFATPPALAVGARGYYFAVLTDFSWTISTMGTVTPHWFKSQTYASGFPGPLTGLTKDDTIRGPQAYITITGNCVNVSELLANGETDYVFTSTVNNMDLYDMGDLPTVPAAIIGVVSKAYLRKSDAGTRQGQLVMRSVATDVTTPDATLSTTWTYVARVDTVDPATGTTWTIAGVNAIKVGQKVTL